MIKFKFFNVFTIVLILLQAVMPIPALAMASAAGTDLLDYAPGSAVTLSGDNSNGAGYLPAESVHVDVSGPNGFAASCEALANENGAWFCQVTLPTDAADGTYDYTTIGQTSGVAESGFFTVTAPPPPVVDPTEEPTVEPTAEPTQEPTAEPTVEPTQEPTAEPTVEPTTAPTQEPTAEPTVVVTPAPAPFIQSDKDDYAPAEVVTLTSGNWQPGEWVIVYVNDDIGQTWSITTNKQADENGAFTYQFSLPDWFVATYRVTATGEFSGIATTSFTDARVVTSATLNGAESVTVAAGASITAVVTVETNGTGANARWRSTGWRISTTGPSSFPGDVACINHVNYDSAGTNSVSFSIAAPGAPGTYNAYFVAFNDDACSSASGANAPSVTEILENGVSVTAATALTLAAPSPASVTYGSAGPVSLSATLTSGSAVSGATITFLVDGSSVGSAATNDSGVATLSYNPSTLDAGSHTVQASFAGQTLGGFTYTGSTSGNQSLTVTQASSTTTVSCPASVTYDGTAQEPCTATVTGAGGLNQSLAVTYSDNTNAGTATASASFAGDANHTGSSDSQTFEIDPATSETTVSCPASVTYDGTAQTPCTVSVTGAGGLNLTPDADYTDNVNAGTATASYTYAGDANHTGSSDSQTFEIDPAASETTVTCPASVTYDGAAQEPCTAVVTGAGGLNQSLAVTYSDNTNAGTATASASYAGDANHNGSSDSQTFEIEKAVSVTDVTCPLSVTYNGAAQTPCTVSVTGAGGLSLTPDADYTDNVNAGTATASYTYPGDANHTGSSDSRNFTIEQAELLVNAVASGKTYGAGDPAFTYTLSGFAGSDNEGNSGITGVPSCTRTAGEDVAGSPYTITCAPGSLSAPNYSFATGAIADFTISQAILTVTADDQTITYGNAEPAFTFQYSGFQFGDGAGDVDTAPVCDVTAPHTDAGTYTISCSGSLDDNYAFAYVNGTLTVDPAALIITADDKSRTYGFANPVLTASYSGFVNGDDEIDLDTPVSLATSADATSPVGSYAITASGAADANYTITFANGTLTVGPKALTITADDQSKTYGSSFTFAGTEFSVVGLVNEDTVDSVTLTSAGAPAAAGVGTYAIEASAAAGSGLENYDITYENGSFTVDARSLTITADDQSKTYGDLFTFAGTEFTTDGLVNGDNVDSVALASAGAAATAEVAGSPYAIVASAAVGTGLENYDITYVDGAFTVGPKALTLTADDQSKTYGDTFTFDGTEFNQVGLVNGDSVDSVTLTSVGAAANATVGSYAIMASDAVGSGLSNYIISYVDGTLAVGPKMLTITADDQGKTYGDAFTFDGTEFNAIGLVNDDTVDSVTLTSTGAAAPAGVGTYAIVASQAVGSGLNNYTIGYVDGTLTISARPITVTADPQTKVYGEADPALTYQITGGSLANGDSFTGGLVRVSGENVSSYDILQGTLALSSDYDLTFVGAQLTITQATLTVTADPQSKTYGEANSPLTFNYSGFQFSDDASVLDAEPACSTTASQFSDVGDYPITCSGGDDNNYSFSYVSSTLTINRRPATVTADAKSKIYGDDNPELTATVENTVNGDVLDYSLTTTAEKYSGAGDYPITVTLGTNPNYDVTPVGSTLSIAKKAATITGEDKSKTYGDNNPVLTAAVVGEVPGGDAINFTLSTAATQFSNVGDYPIIVTLGANPNYDVTAVDGTLTIQKKAASVKADDKSKTYGDTNPVLTATVVDEVAGGDAIQYSLSTTATQFSNVGEYPITVTLGSNPNYDVTATDGMLTIEKKAASVTAEDKSKIYGDDNPELTAVVTGAVPGGDAINYMLSTTADQLSNVGIYSIVVTLGANPNYDVSYTNGTLTITKKAASVTADAKSKVYGADNPELAATVVGQVEGGAIVLYTLDTTALKFSNVGEYPITVTLGSNPNYDVTSVDGTLTITKKAASVSAVIKSKIYGEDNPNLNAVVTGAVSGGDAIEYSLSTTAEQFSGVGNYPITVALGDNPNYEVIKTDATLTITQRAATVTANNKSKTYGDDNPTFDATVTGTVNGDMLNYTLSTLAGKYSDVGGYPITVTLGSNPNYNITPANGTLTITQANLTVTANSQSKIYGDANPSLTLAYSGFLGTDDASDLETLPSCSTSASQFSSVGPYTITCSGGVDNNYSFFYVSDTLTIDQRPATVTVDAKSKTYGDDNPELTATIVNTINGDVLDYSLATTAEKYSDVDDYPITVSLGTNPNYAITVVNGTLTINKKAASVTANDKTKTYGDANPTFDAAVIGEVVGGAAIQYTLATAATQLSNVGDYPITVMLGDNLNYDVTPADGTLTINRKAASVTANNKSKTYADDNPALTATVVGQVPGGDAIEYTLSTTAVKLSSAGDYPITVTLGANPNYEVTKTDGTLTVNKAVLTVTADDQSKYFAGPDPAFTFQYSGFVNGETASVVDTPPTCGVPDPHAVVGSYSIVCSGGLDNNYDFNYVNGTLTVAAWTLKGFYSPVDMSGSLTVYNLVKGGSTVPLKFEIFSGSTELTNAADVKSLTYAQTSCGASSITDEIETVATGGTVLRYDATAGQFVYNWQTPKMPGKCYRVTLTAQDGSVLQAFFKLK